MREITLEAEVTFLEKAQEYYRFPITKSTRISFWVKDSKYSTFSEMYILKSEIQLLKPCTIQLKMVERDFLKNKINPGVEFQLGTYPNIIAKGIVTKIVS